MSDITRDYSFGGMLRRLRVSREITLRSAAKLLGMDAGNLSKMERSELDPPMNGARIEEMCRKLGVEQSASFLRSLSFQHHLSKLKHVFDNTDSLGRCPGYPKQSVAVVKADD